MVVVSVQQGWEQLLRSGSGALPLSWRVVAPATLNTSLLGDTSCAVLQPMAVLPSGTSPPLSGMPRMPCSTLRGRCSPWVSAALGGSSPASLGTLRLSQQLPCSLQPQGAFHPNKASFPSPGHPAAHCHGSQLRRQQPPHPRAARGTLPGGQRQR